ncbi:gliding motility lipoprotein GldB [Salinimicrobium soli]|uniref:gliding motility lipoprotein GldB n=1 Tax=Salinimicrobium soli TaxID=1254399 RepID=UPI003AAAC872
MLKKLIFCCFLAVLFSCAEEDEREAEISKIPVEVDLSRFDQRFANATGDSLPGLKRDFPYLFPKQFPDSVWIEKMQDTIQLELNTAVTEKFPNLQQLEFDLESLFQHVKYYFPQQNIPKVVTLTSDVDYRNQVVWTDSLVLISLDTYLGKDNLLYQGVQEYIRKNFEPEQILPDVAAAFGLRVTPKPRSRNFIAHMIYYGKILYLKDRLIPFADDARKMGYTEEELEWAQNNEDQIWRYFVEQELLYSSDTELHTRFLYPAPFSKFFLQLDNEAPARLGQYIGWQIVKRYMEKQEVPVQEMLQTDAETIFNKSNYKPKK